VIRKGDVSFFFFFLTLEGLLFYVLTFTALDGLLLLVHRSIYCVTTKRM